MVTLLRVKPSAHIMPKVEITEAGIATAAMTVERQLRMKANTTMQAQDAAENQVHVDLVQRGVDVARLVADDFEFSCPQGSWRVTRARFAFTASMTATVLAPGLAQDLQLDGRHAVEPRQRALLFGAVFGASRCRGRESARR